MHKIHWAVPAPTWEHAVAQLPANRPQAMRRPMLLRFATDTFMQDLASLLDDDPARLADIQPRPGETWREYPGAIALPPPGATLLSPVMRRKLGARFSLTDAGKSKEHEQDERQLRRGKKDTTGKGTKQEPPVLKLFQPAHERYYLIAASLVCRFPGLPEHRVDAAKNERVSFVVRRLAPADPAAKTFDAAASDEYAFVVSDAGPAWVKVDPQPGPDAPPHLEAGEERLPMFGSPYVGRDEVPRRLFTGLVPVSRREAYMGAPKGIPVPPSTADAATSAENIGAFTQPVDPRMLMFIDDVLSPWRALLKQAAQVNDTVGNAGFRPDEDNPHVPSQRVAQSDAVRTRERKEARRLVEQTRYQMLHASWLILLDLATYLRRHVPDVLEKINDSTAPDAPTPAQRSLNATLGSITYTTTDLKGKGTKTVSLAQALRDFDTRFGADLEAGPTLLNKAEAEKTFKALPRFSFAPLGWPHTDLTISDTESFAGTPNDLKAAMEAVLRELPADPSVPPPPAAALPGVASDRLTRFVLRCVFERPVCGPHAKPIVSEPTEPFVMAAFFDPDAPARPVRIALPVDTSPAGLRKYQKSAGFVISDVLCGQLNAARKLTLGDLVLSVLPWPFHKDLPEPKAEPCKSGELGLGMLCSLSIPIVTICALILLMIIVSILDYFFRWMPYLITCFPLPLRAKEQL